MKRYSQFGEPVLHVKIRFASLRLSDFALKSSRLAACGIQRKDAVKGVKMDKDLNIMVLAHPGRYDGAFSIFCPKKRSFREFCKLHAIKTKDGFGRALKTY